MKEKLGNWVAGNGRLMPSNNRPRRCLTPPPYTFKAHAGTMRMSAAGALETRSIRANPASRVRVPLTPARGRDANRHCEPSATSCRSPLAPRKYKSLQAAPHRNFQTKTIGPCSLEQHVRAGEPYFSSGGGSKRDHVLGRGLATSPIGSIGKTEK